MAKKKEREEGEEETEEGEEEQEEETPKKKKGEKWIAQEVTTETAPMVVNIEDGKAYQQAAINAIILNKLEKIEKGLLD